MADQPTSPLDDAPEEIKLAVDLIYLLESNEIDPEVALNALKIVQNDLENKLKAICKSCKICDGIFTFRLSNEKEQMLIGTDNYTALCRNCYNLRKNPEENV